MIESELTLLDELEDLKKDFNITVDKLTKDLKRSYKTIERSDRQQTREFLKLKELNKEIEDTQKEIIFTMGAIGESRSKETGNHVKRVAEYSKILALKYGMSEYDAEMLRQASPMHDIGKVAIPDAILNKPARFTPEEFEKMKEHAQLGYDMLKV